MTTVDSSACLKVVTEMFGHAVVISGTPGHYQFSGPVVTLLDIIQRHLGMCFQLVMSEHRVYGHQQPNGSWTGLIGLLQRHEVDFAGTLFVLTPERLASLDFSEPLYIDEYNSIYPRPDVVSDMASFIKPYNAMVWLLVLFTTLVLFGVSQVVLRSADLLQEHRKDPNFLSPESLVPEGSGLQKISGEEQKEAGSRKIKEPLRAIESSALWIWGILLSQSVPWMPSKSQARGVAGVWLLMAFTLGSVYRSNLKAMIIYPRIHLPFSSLGELTHSNIFTIIFNGSAIHKHIMDADNSSSLGGLKKQVQLYYNDQIASAIQDVMNGKGAGLSFTMGILSVMDETFSMTGKCSLYKMPRGFLGPLSLSLAFPKGSPLRNRFDQIIVRLRESGILAKLFSDGLVNSTKCATPVGMFLADAKERPFWLKDFYGVFSIYGAGLLMAASLFLGELMHGGQQPDKRASSAHGDYRNEPRCRNNKFET